MNQSKRGPGMSKSKHGTRPPGHMSTRSTLVSSASKKSVGGGMAPSDKSSNIRVPVQVREQRSVCWPQYYQCKCSALFSLY